MVLSLFLSAAILLSSSSFVSAHGFLWSIGSIGENPPNVRGLAKMNRVIDSLRNPLTTPNMCRGEPVSSTRTAMTLGDTLTITLAISATARHTGACYVELDGVRISPEEQCVAGKVVGCPPVPGSVTNGMCLHTWTFKVQNRESVKCVDCTLRWVWKATHITPNENYENCIDVQLANQNSALFPPVTTVQSSPCSEHVANYCNTIQSPSETKAEPNSKCTKL